jgi:acylphosphatase
MTASGTVGAEFTVRGLVQGVGFRAFVRTHALALGLQGSAINLDNGCVRVLAFGAPDALHALHAELQRGPRFARVDEVTRRELMTRPALYHAATFSIG